MNKVLYTDVRGTYILTDYKRSHGQLLLRKRENTVNTDIIFKSVQGMSFTTTIVGIEIELLNEPSEVVSIAENCHFVTDLGYRIYQITTADRKRFYINAGVFGVYNNNLDILVSSLGDFSFSDENKLVFWSED